MTQFRWGILGTGRIAGLFAEGLAAVPDASLVAVGSRTQASADRFADRFSVPRRHASYQALAEDCDVDAFYISTPHSLHRENALQCLRAGRAVLCEKPFAINAAEGEDIIRTARERGVFLMEAMWTRFVPVTRRVRSLLAEGAIGEPRMVHCDFGFRTDFDAKSRMFDPSLGGGALLDVGVYCVSAASMVFGDEPSDIAGLAHLGETGVDEESAWVCRYPRGQLAVLSSAVRANTLQECVITGTDGRIRIPRFWHPEEFHFGKECIRPDKVGNGFNYEAIEVAECVRAGQLESDEMRLDETLAILRTLDKIRAQWGLRYPMES